jgi:DNA-binding winged helix-turn-helix (wHTH) protein/pimeloyl-ACP methyl ester carboxylesterase
MLYLFDAFALDTDRCELCRGAELIPVEPQVFDLLVYLIRNRERVVSRDELRASIWGGRNVSESVLDSRIGSARTAIGDSGKEQRLIKTLPRKGVRFVGDVREEARAGTPTSPTDATDPQIAHHASRSQELMFCRTTDGVNLAVACVGQGIPVVRTSHWMTHVEYDWQSPLRSPLLHFLADRFRLVRYDCRNNGLSDWDAADVSFEALQHDLETVVGAVGLHSYALLGISQGAAISIAHAARYPKHVSKMIIHGGYALGYAKRGARKGFDVKGFLTLMREGWGDEHSAFPKMLGTAYLPNASAEQIRFFANLQHVASSPENTLRLRSVFDEIDVVDLLPKVSVPTLVMHCLHDNFVPFEEGRRIATLVPNAKFLALESENHVPQPGEPAWPIFLEAIETFLSDA